MHQRRALPALCCPKGFTLIELSIVLVIIALIVGGVLVGRDLIASAQMRAAIAQLQSYQAAVNVFKNKYNDLPGDISNFSRFGFATRTGAKGRGNSDGIIQGCQPFVEGTSLNGVCGENFLFWNDLATANLIGEPTLSGTDAPLGADVNGNFENYIPAAKLSGRFFWVSSKNGINYLFIVNPKQFLSGTGRLFWVGNGIIYSALTAGEQFLLDSKLDDAVPTTGDITTVVSSDLSIDHAGSNMPGVTDCYNNVTNTYNVNLNTKLESNNGCVPKIRARF